VVASPCDDRLLAAEALDFYHSHPWEFIRDNMLTIDEADSGATKRFPDLPYLRMVCETWQREKLLAIPKSRRMMLTWIMLALHLHLALFNPNAAIFIQSKKAEDSYYLLGDNRLMFLYRSLPKWMFDYGLPQATTRQGFINFSNGAMIKGIAQGPDQLRQYTATAVMCDEMAFWDAAETTWRALRPVMQGGGRVAMVSSAAPGFFSRIVLGKLRRKD
jgi:hypothetical protein